MSGDQDLRVRERAHAIWEREGRPQGREIAHWYMAAAEIAGEAATPGRKAKAAAAEAADPKAAGAPKRAAAARASAPSRSRKAAD